MIAIYFYYYYVEKAGGSKLLTDPGSKPTLFVCFNELWFSDKTFIITLAPRFHFFS